MHETISPLFFLHAITTSYMVGVVWFVHVVHYPSFAFIQREQFSTFHQRYLSQTTFLIAIPMVIEALTGGMLLAFSRGSDLLFDLNFVLIVFTWVATFVLSVPKHNTLSKEYADEIQKELVRTNLPRAILWTLRLCLVMVIFLRPQGFGLGLR